MSDITIHNPAPIVVQVKGGKTTAISSPTGSATKLVELSDVSTANLADGKVLTYVDANGAFEFQAQASASATDNFARAQANAAFDQANAAYANANTAIYTAAQIRANVSNTSPINYEPTTGVISHADSAVVPTTYGNTTFVPTITVDAKGHVTSITNTAIALSPSTDEFARAHANAAYNQANAAYANANTAIYTAAQIRANVTNTAPINYDSTTGTISHAVSGVTPTTYGNTTFVPTITVDDKGHVTAITNTAIALPPSTDEFARAQANAAFNQANTANVTGQAAFDKANGAIYTAAQIRANVSNTAPINYDPSTGIISHAVSGVVATGHGDAATVPKITVDDKGHVTSVTNTSIAISTAQITSGTLAVARGGTGQTAITVNGSLLIGNTVSGGFDVNPLTQGTGILITNDKGSITIAATGGSAIDQYARDKANGAAQNAFVTLNVAGQSDIVADSNTDTLTIVAGSGILITTDAATDTLTIAATGGAAQDQFARDTANGAYANANTAIYTATQIRANISNTAPINYEPTTGVVSHADSGVVATGHGDAATIPKIIVNATGHVTSVTNTAVAIAASQITSGTLAVARGGTGQTAITVNGSLLIGNTVSGGFDVNAITQGTNIVITNDKGSITLAASDAFAQAQANAAFAKANTIRKSITVPSPLVTDNITFFFTDIALTFNKVVSVVRGSATPNVVFLLSYESSRHTGADRTNICENITCANTTNGVFTTSFANATVPANNYVTLTFSTVSGTVDELHVTMFG